MQDEPVVLALPGGAQEGLHLLLALGAEDDDGQAALALVGEGDLLQERDALLAPAQDQRVARLHHLRARPDGPVGKRAGRGGGGLRGGRPLLAAGVCGFANVLVGTICCEMCRCVLVVYDSLVCVMVMQLLAISPG